MISLERLYENPPIKSFLNDYPSHYWSDCVQACLVFGIQTIQKKFPFGLTVEQLMTLSGLSKPEVQAIKPTKTKRHSHHSTKRRTPSQRSKRSNVSGGQHKHKRENRKQSEKQKKTEPGIRKKTENGEKKHSISWKELPDFKPLSDQPQISKKQKIKLKIPNVLKEPPTCTLEDARSYFQFLSTSPSSPVLQAKSPPNSSEIMKIANDFLNNPLTYKLTSQSDKRIINKK